MEMKNVQIPYDLFLALLQHHLMMEDGYEDEIRYGLEQKLEAMLDTHGIFYDKTEVWIESEKLYEVLYSFEMEV